MLRFKSSSNLPFCPSCYCNHCLARSLLLPVSVPVALELACLTPSTRYYDSVRTVSSRVPSQTENLLHHGLQLPASPAATELQATIFWPTHSCFRKSKSNDHQLFSPIHEDKLLILVDKHMACIVRYVACQSTTLPGPVCSPVKTNSSV